MPSSSQVAPSGADSQARLASARSQSLLGGVLAFAAGTLASRILGLLRDRMTAIMFEPGVRDAFVVAFRLPNLFRRLLGEGSLSVAFIPLFVKTLDENGNPTEASKKLASGVLALLLTVTITLSLLGIVFMDEIVRLMVPGDAYRSVPGKLELTVRLARIMFSFLVLVTLYAYAMALLNSFRQFALSGLAPCLFNLSLISAAWISPRMAAPEEALAWSVIVGGFLQAALLWPTVWRHGVVYWLAMRRELTSGVVVPVLRKIAPSLIGIGVLQFTAIVNMQFASYLPQGTHTYFYLADRILELPLALFAVSMSTAMLPLLSESWAKQDRSRFQAQLAESLSLVMFVALPAAVGMAILARPVVDVLFAGREFKIADAQTTALVVALYAPAVIIVGSVRILSQAFYGMGNTWLPAVAGVVAFLVHLVAAGLGTHWFGIPGLAGALSISALANLLVLHFALRKELGSESSSRSIFLPLARMVLATLPMALVAEAGRRSIVLLGDRWSIRCALLFLTISLAILVYGAASRMLKIKEYELTVGRLFNRLAKKFGRGVSV